MQHVFLPDWSRHEIGHFGCYVSNSMNDDELESDSNHSVNSPILVIFRQSNFHTHTHTVTKETEIS